MNDFGDILFFGNCSCCHRSWCGSCPLMDLFVCCLMEVPFIFVAMFNLALVVWVGILFFSCFWFLSH